MKTTTRARLGVGIAGATAFALVVSGCASSNDPEAGGDVTLNLASFNDFGYSDELLAEYEAANPGVTIVHNRAATSNDARSNFFQKLGAGSGLSDVEAVEIDWFAEMLQYSDKLADLSDPALEGRWVDWKTDAATDADGRLIAYGTDIGPEAICYRSDLFAEAGLPTDREEVATLLQGDWDKYFAVGHQYKDATGKAWFDSAGATYQGMINQVKNAYETEGGDIIAASNPEVEAIFNKVLTESADLSAHLGQWSEDWFAALSSGDYATMLCPGWMLGVISGNAADTKGWDVANVFPGGGGNWGGSYLTVPAQGKNIEAAKKLAAWLTAPEQQLKAFAAAGTFPSQVDAYTSADLLDATNEYFNNAPTGAILIDRAKAVTVAPYKGAKYFAINDLAQKSLTRVEDGQQSIADSWAQFLTEVAAL
jgi:cellobiose transport system substrate-binding protein